MTSATGMHVQLLRVDITSLKVDAMVADRNEEGTSRTGGNLLARFIIQVVVPEATDADVEQKLRQVTFSLLEEAERLAVASVGIPPLGCGREVSSLERCARAMLGAALDFRPRARSLQRAVFCLYGAKEHGAFARVLQELEH